MRGSEDIGSKGHFSAKKGIVCAKNPEGAKDFFSKMRMEHFLDSSKGSIVQKII